MSRGAWCVLALLGFSMGMTAIQTTLKVRAIDRLTEETKALREATEETNVALERLERQGGRAPRFR